MPAIKTELDLPLTQHDDKAAIPTAFIQAMPRWTPTPSPGFAAAEAPAKPPRRMNLNESPYPPSARAIEAMREACGSINRYPDANWRALTAALSARTGVPDTRIVVGNGSDELIASATRIALTPGDEVIAPVPSFGSFAKGAAIEGAKLVSVPVRADGACDIDAMLSAVTARTRLFFLVTPNNPTGGMLAIEEIGRVARALSQNVLLVLDEAYHEFAMQAGGDDPLAVMTTRAGPWAIFRSFSKAYGLAGVRVGYLLCGSEAVAGGFQVARNAFTVNGIAQAGAVAALEDEAHMRHIVALMAGERERLSAGLRGLGLEPLASVGNFVTTPTDRPGAEVLAYLREQGILIAGVPAPGYENHIRITIGLPEDTDAVLSALESFLAG
jgi:histidinol-phosphate aminotransferase